MLKCKENIPSYYNTAKFKTHSMNTKNILRKSVMQFLTQLGPYA